MNKSILRTAAFTAAAAFLLIGCSKSNELTDEEIKQSGEILNKQLTAEELTDITEPALADGRKDKFKAVKKVYETTEGEYIFISEPVAYNGPVTVLTVIDSSTGKTAGMRIIRHEETEHYVRDMENPWFADRFAGKAVTDYLILARLEGKKENEVVMITGATVTTEGIINGVNAAMGVYMEYVLGKEAESVDLMVEHIK